MAKQAAGIALGVVLGLAGGLTAGHVLFGNDAPEPRALGALDGAREPAPGEPPSAGVPAALRAEPGPPDSPAYQPGTDTEAATPGTGAPAALAPVEIPSPPTRHGDGLITVRVTRDDGRPIAGVTIELIETQQAATATHDWRPGDPAPGAITAPAAPHLFLSRTTAADGATRFDRLPDGSSFVVSGFLAGHDVKRSTATPPARGGYWDRRGRFVRSSSGGIGNQYTVTIGQTIDFVALPVRKIPVRILLPGGEPAERAQLSVQTGQAWAAQPWTREDPHLRLSPGVYRLKTSVGEDATSPLGGLEYSAPDMSVEVPESGEVAAITIQLSMRRGIKGRVHGLAADAGSWCYLWAMPLSGDGAPDLKALMRSPHRTNVRGNKPEYAFRDLAPGTWLVGARPASSNEITVSGQVTVGDGIATFDITLTGTAPGETQRIRVRTPAGVPLGDVAIWLYGANGRAVQPLERTRTPDGSHRVTWPAGALNARSANGETKPLRLLLSSTRYGYLNVPLTDGQRDVDAQFPEPSLLEVTVAGYAGSGYVNRLTVSIAAAPSAGAPNGQNLLRGMSPRRQQQGQVDAEGRFLYGPASPGRVRVTLTATPDANQKKRGSRRLTLVTQDVELAPGRNHCTLQLPQLHTVTVVVPGAAKGFLARVHSADQGGYNSAHADASSGQAVFEGIAAGLYWVTVWTDAATEHGDATGTGTMKVQLPGTGVVTFERAAEDAAHISLWDDEEGPMVKAGFKDGDQIIAVAGKSFDGHRAFVRAITSAPSGPITFKVWRDGATVQLAFDRDLLIAGLTDEGDSTQADIWVDSRE